MKQTITQKQEEILKYLYRYRFLNRIQIQTFLNHKYHKRINDWLKDLNQKEYINRIYSTKFGENTKPAIYYIGLNGIRYLKTREDCSPEILRKLYRDKDRSESFIDQCLLIGDIILDLRAAAIRSKEEEYELSYAVAMTVDLANSEYRFNFLSELNVDLLLRKQKKKKNGRKTVTNFFIFSIISPTLPRYSIRKRIKNFIDLYNGYDWDNVEDNPFPTIMIVCSNLATMIYGKRLTKRLLEEEDNPKDLHFRFTTVDQIKDHSVTSEVWEEV